MSDDNADNVEQGGTPPVTPAESKIDFRLLAAGAIVLIYILVAVWLLHKLGSGPLTDVDNDSTKGKAFGTDAWEQIVYLLTAIGTIATGAAGVLLGVQVQQTSVRSANRRAELSEVEAAEAKKKKDDAQAAAADALEKMEAANSDVEKAAIPPAPQTMAAIKADLRRALKP